MISAHSQCVFDDIIQTISTFVLLENHKAFFQSETRKELKNSFLPECWQKLAVSQQSQYLPAVGRPMGDTSKSCCQKSWLQHLPPDGADTLICDAISGGSNVKPTFHLSHHHTVDYCGVHVTVWTSVGWRLAQWKIQVRVQWQELFFLFSFSMDIRWRTKATTSFRTERNAISLTSERVPSNSLEKWS